MKRTRRHCNPVSYAESDVDDSDASFAEATPPPPKRPRSSRSSHVTTNAEKHSSEARPRPSRKTQTTKRAKVVIVPHKAISAPQAVTIPSDGVIPPWETLPYEIILSVFRYAATPLLDENHRVTSAAGWLCRASRTCKAFTEPALSVLYDNPPIDTPSAAFQLLDLVQSDTTMNYRLKVKTLDLDVFHVLAHTAPGRGHLELHELVGRLPNLSGLHVCHPIFRAPFKTVRAGRGVLWRYGSLLLSAIEEAGLRLKSWTWSAPMMYSSAVPQIFQPHMPVHEMTPFRDLRHLTLAGLKFSSSISDVPEVEITSDSVKKERFKARTADCLKHLIQLRSLTFISCTSSTWDVLSHLPNLLTSLTITNSNIISSTLSTFLTTFGHALTDLTLNHNDHLNLDFLPVLRPFCHSLQTLSVDLTYYSPLSVLDTAAEPAYSNLLDETHIPTWPSTLRTLTLLHLRKWSTPSALNFFTSLTDAAGELPYLRHLELRAMLPEASWRERAALREKWTERLKTVFLRDWETPRPELASYKAYRDWKASQDELDDAPLAVRAVKRSAHGGGRTRGDSKGNNSSEGKIGTRTRASQAERKRQRDQDDKEREEDEFLVIHGMCDVVDISIDNMRPSEVRFNEGDFMDSEPSGDEEWNEDVDELVPQGRSMYAW